MAIAFDGPTKLMTLSAGTTIVSVRDLYSRWVDWLLTGDNSKYVLAFASLGGDDVDAGAGTKVPVYAFLVNGWKVKPQEANHTLNVTDGILLVSGGGDPFVNTTGSFVVRVNYQQPVQAISFDSGGGGGGATAAEVWAYGDRQLTVATGLTSDQALMLLEMWKLHGLDPSNPLVVSLIQRAAGAGVVQSIAESAGVTTVQRV